MKLKKYSFILLQRYYQQVFLRVLDLKLQEFDSNEEINLSRDWNDIDSQQVAQEMIGDSSTDKWINDYKANTGRKKPRVIIGNVVNKTEEHIQTDTFIKDLEKNLINSGNALFIASKDQRKDVRAERRSSS
jgi:PBP1b-binding outer membrane lipoprotein LpoB